MTSWNKVSKNSSSFSSQNKNSSSWQPGARSPYALLIDDQFLFLIDDKFKLLLSDDNVTNWSPQAKN